MADKKISTRKKISKFIKYEVLSRKRRKEKLWLQEKLQVLNDVKGAIPEQYSLDVSRFYDTYIFHDEGNTLVRRDGYEPITQHALMVLIYLDGLRGNKTVLADIGVNIGLHTFYLKSQYPGMEVIAFDPSPASWIYFELSLKYNGTSNVRLEKIALSDQSGTLDFYRWGHESSADALCDTGRVPGVVPEIIKVPALKMDDLKNLPNITVIKMDTEGAELSILSGAEKMLRQNRPFILLEFNSTNIVAFGVTPKDIMDKVLGLEYDLYTLDFKKLDLNSFIDAQKHGQENFIMMPNDFGSSINR